MDKENGIKRVDAEELFDKFWPMVLRRCREMLGDAENAADIAQEVFVIVLEKQDSLHAGHPGALLWRMATNHCLKAMKSYASRYGAPDGDSLLERIASAEDVESEVVSRGVLRKLFRQHPESSRTIAVLHLVDGMTLEETARMVNMSVSGVRKRLRALKKTLAELEGV
ncbi:MAG: RNA polymerase sigma factor [Chitinispirillia bacterium]|nr:RNA polymerase sigma factor [Chitinispirillia bacterium]MCL2268492.1 RNA polymerase sigma factor [Chitinispirillia bacterium]